MGNCKLFCHYENKIEIIINKNISLNNNINNNNNSPRNNDNTEIKFSDSNLSKRVKYNRVKNENKILIENSSNNITTKLNHTFENNNSNSRLDDTKLDSFKRKDTKEKKITQISENNKIDNQTNKNIFTVEEKSSIFHKFTKNNNIKKIQKFFRDFYFHKLNKINLLDLENNKMNLNFALKQFKTIKYDCGSVYKGQIIEDMRNGLGIIYDQEYTFIGFFINDQSNGVGKMTTKNGFIYFGKWLDFKINGPGKFSNENNGTIYEGYFNNNQQNGFGIEKWISNSNFVGEYKDDIKSGIGILSFNDSSYYSGYFQKDDMNGIGTYIHKDGSFYEGEWKNNKMNGYGIYSWADGRRFEGEFVDDFKNGFGVLKNKTGKVYFGNWLNDHLEGEGGILENKIVKKFFFVKSKKRKILPDCYLLTFDKIIDEYINNSEK